LLAAALLALAVALGAAAGAAARAGESLGTAFSGHETVIGAGSASFAGWTHAGDGSAWVPSPGDGGSWSTSVTYTGTPGLGSSVSFTGGTWSWQQANGTIRQGQVLSGSVRWPPDGNTDIGCGKGIGVVAATLSLGGATPAGGINACLDDTHLATVFPPQIWGNLTLAISAPTPTATPARPACPPPVTPSPTPQIIARAYLPFVAGGKCAP
jgi:hypothetical protein